MGADEEPMGIKTSNAALWIAILGAPFLWLCQLLINYVFVPWACNHGTGLPIHLVSWAVIIVAAVLAVRALRQWQRINAPARARFMAMLGLLMSTLFVLAMLTQEIAACVYSPCLH
jgi:hypothetical protein